MVFIDRSDRFLVVVGTAPVHFSMQGRPSGYYWLYFLRKSFFVDVITPSLLSFSSPGGDLKKEKGYYSVWLVRIVLMAGSGWARLEQEVRH